MSEQLNVIGYRVSMPDEPELGHWLDESAEEEPQIQHHEPLVLKADADAVLAAKDARIAELEAERDAWVERATSLQEKLDVAATPSEDGREVPEVVGVRISSDGFGSYIADSAMGVGALYPGDVREPLMTVAQHERIVAAKDAEIATLRESLASEVYKNSTQVVKENEELRAEIARLNAQPARQVGGGDVREALSSYERKTGRHIMPKGFSESQDQYVDGWLARAALAPAAVVMPEYERNHAGLIVESVLSPWNAALDEVASLNRRAIPVVIPEAIATVLPPDPYDDRSGFAVSLVDRIKLEALPSGTKLYAEPLNSKAIPEELLHRVCSPRNTADGWITAADAIAELRALLGKDEGGQ